MDLKICAMFEVGVTWVITLFALIWLLSEDIKNVWAWIAVSFAALVGIIPSLKCCDKCCKTEQDKYVKPLHVIVSLPVILALSVLLASDMTKWQHWVATIAFVLSIGASHYAFVKPELVYSLKVLAYAIFSISPTIAFYYNDLLGYVLFTGVALYLAYVHKGVLLKTDANAVSGRTGGGVGWRQLRVVYR